MREDLLVQRMREALQEWMNLPAKVRFQAMVDRGTIDEKGNVLVRMPEPPKRKRKSKADSPTAGTSDRLPPPEAESMREDLLTQQMREALREWAKLPAEVRFQEMIDAGVIDEKGHVLLRMPEPPKKKRKGKGRSRHSQGD
jgi:hypothetical protein